ncbi:MAG TPA: YihY/virulence factor BrkB family protein [Terriglobales bacterium]
MYSIKEDANPALDAGSGSIPTPGKRQQDTLGIGQTLRRHGIPTLKYLTKTEVHTYAFSVAANAILSFIPSVVLMLTLTRKVFHSPTMYEVVIQLLRDYLPSNQDFIIKNMRALAGAHKVQIFSMVMLVISSTGIFLPLEVALNKVWGFKSDRSYLGNQLISLGLAIGCGLLALLSIAATAGNWHLLGQVLPMTNILARAVGYMVMKVFAILASIAIFFVIYWVLPNGKVRPSQVLPAAMVTGILFEVAKQLYVLSLPWLDFQTVYGPFSVSVTLMFWAYVSGMLLLGGAFLSAAEYSGQNRAKSQAAQAH